jgi:hypothetical protein
MSPNTRGNSGPGEDGVALKSDKSSLKTLRDSIVAAVHKLGQTFLIIDGLDRCGSRNAQVLEDTLSYLQKHRLHMMITSCISPERRWTRARRWSCDVCDAKKLNEIHVWVCQTCYDELASLNMWERYRKLNEELFVVCDACQKKANTGKRCNR